MRNYYYIPHTNENLVFCTTNKIPFVAHPEQGRIEVFANHDRIEALKNARIKIWCEHEVFTPEKEKGKDATKLQTDAIE